MRDFSPPFIVGYSPKSLVLAIVPGAEMRHFCDPLSKINIAYPDFKERESFEG
jgi:hypothetical protein